MQKKVRKKYENVLTFKKVNKKKIILERDTRPNSWSNVVEYTKRSARIKTIQYLIIIKYYVTHGKRSSDDKAPFVRLKI